MAAKQKTMDKWKKKKWFEILAPKSFDEKKIGETPAEKNTLLIGRTVVMSLDNLTGQRKQRSIKVKFKIKSAQESKAFTEIVGHEIDHSYIRRLSRRRQSKIDLITKVKTKDRKNVAVTAVCLAQKTERAKEKRIRKLMEKIIVEEAGKNEFGKLIQEFLFGVTTSKILKQAREIAKIKRIEIVKSKLLEGKK